ASFELITYTITASVSGSGGSISPSGSVSVNSGASQAITITPSANYKISDVKVDGASVGAVSSYTFSSVSAAHTITASFESTAFTITASVTGSGGAISPSGSVTVTSGTSKTFAITADANYKVSDVKVDGASVGAVSSYTFATVTANHTITASFESTAFTITASVTGSGGAISPSGSVSVTSGTSKTFAITADTNYKVSDVKVDGTSVGAVSSYTFATVTANHTITASFEPTAFTITASVSGSGGTISPSGSVSVTSGSSKTFTITPAANFKIYDVMVNGTSVGAVSSYTISNITANQTITAQFQATGYTITASVVGNGTISPSGVVSVTAGANKIFYIMPAVNNKIADVQVDGVSVGAVTSYKFRSVTANHTITATFKSLVYTITASAQGNGTISPSGSTTATKGSRKSFTIAPAVSCKILDVQVDGVSVGAVSSYTFRNISANHSILAVFSSLQVAVADAGPDQTVSGSALVTLNGSKSSHDAGIASYKWVQTAGPKVVLKNPKAKVCKFVAPETTEPVALQFKLKTVSTTGEVATDTCYVNVSATSVPPAAKTTTDQVVTPYTIVTLDASNSTDSDGGVASYNWIQTAGPAVSIMNADTPYASFVAPDAGASGCSLAFKLAVSDNSGLKTTDRALVSVREMNDPPVADAGDDQVANSGAQVVLNGKESSDPENRKLTYRWTQIRGVPVTLSNPMSAAPSFKAPNVAGTMDLIFMVTVTDKGGLSATDKCVVTVQGSAQVAAAK
ncbi:MAG: REJ domain-containing protein, partial [Syntrophobacter sp.]